MKQITQKNLINGVKKFDLFVQPIPLLINQHTQYQTVFGSFLTLGLLLLFANLFYQKVSSLFDKTNPNILNTEIYHSQPDQYKLASNNFTLTFAIQNSTYFTYIDESIYVVNAYMMHKYKNNINQEIWTQQQIPLIICNTTDSIKQDSLRDYFSHMDLSTNYCIDWNNLNEINLQGTFDADYYQYIIITFNTCNEKTKKGKDCKDQQTIQQTLDQNYFSLQMSSYTVDTTNFTQPFNPKGQDMYTTISSKIQKEISVYMEPLAIFTDTGFITTDQSIQKTLRYQRQTEMLDLSETDLIMNFVIRLDTTERVYYRSYSKIQEILAELGGLWQVLFSVFYIIARPLNRICYYLDLINQIYNKKYKQQINIISQNFGDMKFNIDKTIQKKSFFSPNDSQNKDLLVSDNQTKLTRNRNSIFLQELKDEHEKNKNNFINSDDITPPIFNKQKQQNTIKNSCFHYLQQFIIKQQKKSFTIFEALQAAQCIHTKENERILEFKLLKEQLMQQTNIVNIIEKINQIDKLKSIIFNKEQRILFENYTNQQNKETIIQTNNQDQIQQALIYVIQDENNYISQNLLQQIDKSIEGLIKKSTKIENEQNI